MTTTPTEEWREIPGFPSYEASTEGRIRSKTRKIPHRLSGEAERAGKVLAGRLVGKGYLQVALFTAGKRSNQYVARLVALTFIPNPEGKPEVNHEDGVKTNNRVGNLEWSTRPENVQHAFDNGLQTPKAGEDHPAFRHGRYVGQKAERREHERLAATFGV